jgi:uncharacterized protein YigA (DUF484 family)
MTPPTSKTRAPAASALADETSVTAFLSEHPDFFDSREALLATLRLPHHRGDGGTVSLVERQLDVLRERSREHELRLKTLIDNGHANDALAEKIHRLAVRLIAVDSVQGRIKSVELSLRDDFNAAEFVILLTGAVPGLASIDTRSIRFVDVDHAELKSFDSLFDSGKPRCGRIRDSQRDFLFPSNPTAVGSAALVPLGARGSIGLLAIASADVDHFNPTMSTEFLARIGELISAALHRSALVNA